MHDPLDPGTPSRAQHLACPVDVDLVHQLGVREPKGVDGGEVTRSGGVGGGEGGASGGIGGKMGASGGGACGGGEGGSEGGIKGASSAASYSHARAEDNAPSPSKAMPSSTTSWPHSNPTTSSLKATRTHVQSTWRPPSFSTTSIMAPITAPKSPLCVKPPTEGADAEATFVICVCRVGVAWPRGRAAWAGSARGVLALLDPGSTAQGARLSAGGPREPQ